jgi:hypothetical protein
MWGRAGVGLVPVLSAVCHSLAKALRFPFSPCSRSRSVYKSYRMVLCQAMGTGSKCNGPNIVTAAAFAVVAACAGGGFGVGVVLEHAVVSNWSSALLSLSMSTSSPVPSLSLSLLFWLVLLLLPLLLLLLLLPSLLLLLLLQSPCFRVLFVLPSLLILLGCNWLKRNEQSNMVERVPR